MLPIVVSLVAALVISTLVLSGCKKNKEKEPETFVSNVSLPVWTAPADYDYSASMTAVVKVDLAALYLEKAADFVLKDDDLLAAFSGETCLGVASPKEGLFYLYMATPLSLTSENALGKVTLRYYSAHFKNVFVAIDAFEFKNDERIGTVSAPFEPKLVVEK